MDKHTKSDRTDAMALAKLPMVAKEKVYELYLPSTELGTLCRKTKHLAKLTQQAASRKTRVKNIFSMLNPGVLETFGEQKFSTAGKVFFNSFSDPFMIVKLGKKEFLRRFQELCPSRVSEVLLERIYKVSVSTTKIYEPMKREATLPFDLHEVEEELRIELDLLKQEESKIASLKKQIAILYRSIDPQGYLMTPPGIGAHYCAGYSGNNRGCKQIPKHRLIPFLLWFRSQEKAVFLQREERLKYSQGSLSVVEEVSIHCSRGSQTVGS